MRHPSRALLRGAALLAALFVALLSAAALAHPLGNFTINHFTRLTVGEGGIAVRFVVDLAEIPTFQELSRIRAGQPGDRSSADCGARGTRSRSSSRGWSCSCSASRSARPPR